MRAGAYCGHTKIITLITFKLKPFLSTSEILNQRNLPGTNSSSVHRSHSHKNSSLTKHHVLHALRARGGTRQEI